MFRGFIIGSGVALALSVLLVAAVSLLAPLPQAGRPMGEDAPRTSPVPGAPVIQSSKDDIPTRPEPLPARAAVVPQTGPLERDPAPQSGERTALAAVAVPASSEFNRPPVDRDPVAPRQDDQPQVAARATSSLGRAALSAAPTADTDTAALPRVVASVEGVSAPQSGRAPNVPAPVQEGAPQTFRDVDAPMAADADIAAAPEQDSTAVDPGQSADAAGASPSEQNGTGTSLVVEATPPSNKPPFVLADAIAPFRNGDFLHPTDTAGPITLVEDPIQAPRRIQEAPVAEPKPERAPIVPRRLVLDSDRAAQEEAAAAEQAAKTAKIVVNAVPFENPDALPLFGIVLIDDGNGDVTRGNLLSFDLPVTFALDPTRPGAVEAAKAYRDAGHEVLMLADAIPANAQSVDVEVALAGALAEMPIAVGVLDRQEASLTNDRDALGGLLAPMSEAGLGLVAYKGGLNSGITRAARSGVPTTTVYRILDKEQERPTVITRYLDRATFEAAQNGHAVVVGRATTDTVTALYSWSAGRRAGTVAVAPISHILKSASAENGG